MNYERLYRYRFRDIDQQARAAVWREIATFVHAQLGAPERLLDPAAGRGELINAVPARERWAVDRVAYAEGTSTRACGWSWRRAGGRAAGGLLRRVFVSNFLEHLPSQEAVAAFLERMHALLRPGGRIAIMGPNFRYCAKEYFDMADHTRGRSPTAPWRSTCTRRASSRSGSSRAFCPTRSPAGCRPRRADARVPSHAGRLAAARQAVPRDRAAVSGAAGVAALTRSLVPLDRLPQEPLSGLVPARARGVRCRSPSTSRTAKLVFVDLRASRRAGGHATLSAGSMQRLSRRIA